MPSLPQSCPTLPNDVCIPNW